jgi:hypothetical protein
LNNDTSSSFIVAMNTQGLLIVGRPTSTEVAGVNGSGFRDHCFDPAVLTAGCFKAFRRSGSFHQPILFAAVVCCWGLPVLCGLNPLSAQPVPAPPTEVSAGNAVAASGPVRVSAGTEVVRRWQPHQHLYVKGDLGIGREQLDAFEAWLDQHATNWTVVLLESAQGETYVDVEGRNYSGIDAVEDALGKGLPSQTSFGQLVDPRTQERNGAFFLLFLKERKFSYYGSDAQDRRGLGENRWAGTLDRPAIAAMRSGGRIIDAAKDTITSIDRQLDQRIAAEKTQREQREATARTERARAIEQAKASIKTANESVVLLEQKTSALLRDQPGLSGDLARPDLARMRADLNAAQSALDNNNLPAVASLANNVTQRAQTHIQALDEYLQAASELDARDQTYPRLAGSPYHRAAQADLESGRQALDKAHQEYQRGDSAYKTSLASATQSLRTAEGRIQAAKRTTEFNRQLALLLSVVALAGLGVLGYGLNRRRLPLKKEALELAGLWSNGLGEKTIALFDLLERVSGVLGSSSDEAAQRYSGETLKLSQQIIQDVDELFIMSACAGRILNDTQALLDPPNAPARWFNLFAARHYRAAIRRLRDESIRFKPEDGLELVVRGPKTERDTLLGHLESYQPFAMSFNQLIEAFNERASRALANLEQVESSLVQVGDTLESLQKQIQTVRSRESDLIPAGESGRWFRVSSVFSQLLPAAQKDQSEALKIAMRDAVGALQGYGAAARQKAGDAQTLVELAAEFHQSLKPKLLTAADCLRSAQLEPAWIYAAVDALSQRADQIAQAAVQKSMASDCVELKNEVAELAHRAAQTVTLDQARREVAQKSIDDAAALIEATRKELAKPLGRNPDRILRESGLDPSDRVMQAREQLTGVKAALERGDVVSAQSGLDAVSRLAAEACQIVEATHKAYDTHETLVTARREETDRLTALLPEHEQILSQIQRDYAPSVLLLGQGDSTHPNANGTVQDNLDETRELLAKARQGTDQAVKVFREAQILQADGLLEQTKAQQELAGFRLQEIVDKQTRLQQTESANHVLFRELEKRTHELAPTVDDARTMMPTVQAFAASQQQLADAERLFDARPNDPFFLAEQLSQIQRELDRVAEQARCDGDVFGEAERSLKAAATQLEMAQRLAREAASDSVADSPAIIQASRELEHLMAALAQAQTQIQAAHMDWTALDAEADRIGNEAGRAAAVLRGELQAAQSALAAMTSAATAVRATGLWSGSFGVAIGGCPGSDRLTQARDWLQRGSYEEARRTAEAACRVAELALAEAKAEVLRRKRAEEERLERERRAREQAEWHHQHSASSSSWGHSGSGFGHSTFSSGSGVSHSSFSSGSGVGRSGW